MSSISPLSESRLARVRPSLPMLAFTPDEVTANRLCLTWGVQSYMLPSLVHTSTMINKVDDYLISEGRCTNGDIIVVVAGRPHGVSGTTNSIRVHVVGGVS